jgi:hypothetical protein
MTMDTNSITADQARDIINGLLFRQHASNAIDYLGKGIAGGAAVGGLGLLVKQLSRQANPARSTFTTPVMSTVYVTDKKDKAKSKTAAAPPTPVQSLANNDKWSMAAKVLGLLAGVPIGAGVVNTVYNRTRSKTHDAYLKDLYGDYEAALQDYAKTKDGKKVANLTKIAESPGALSKLQQYLLAYAVGAPIVSGAIGFADQWGKRKGKDLEAAELALQAAREKRNPTYPVTSVTSIPDGNTSKQKELRERLASEVLGDVDTSYLS